MRATALEHEGEEKASSHAADTHRQDEAPPGVALNDAPPELLSARMLIRLQAMAGNTAVAGLLEKRTPPFPLEKEGPGGASLPFHPEAPPAVMHLQKTVGNATVSAAIDEQEPSLVKDVVNSGGGAPLDRDTRGFMESRFGADFGDVRVHTDGKAGESAQSVQAHAYTVGNDIVFQSGKYAKSESGQRTLAHELTHVIQQRSGPVAGTPAPSGIKISHPSDSFEQAAESNADRVMSSNAITASMPSAAGPAPVQREGEEAELQGTFVQRAGDDEEEEVQGAFVQREAEEDEPEEA